MNNRKHFCCPKLLRPKHITTNITPSHAKTLTLEEHILSFTEDDTLMTKHAR